MYITANENVVTVQKIRKGVISEIISITILSRILVPLKKEKICISLKNCKTAIIVKKVDFTISLSIETSKRKYIIIMTTLKRS